MTIDWDDLIRPDRVHGSLYTDPAVFQAELEHIWYRTWVYVGHVSEVPAAERLRAQVDRPAAGDHDPRPRRRDPPAAQPLHRTGPTRCATSRAGTRTTFRCPYHGWTFANTGRPARLPVQQRVRRARAQGRPRAGHGAPRRADPRVRVRLVRAGRADAARAPRPGRRRLRPARAPLPDGRGRVDGRLAAAHGQGQLEDARRERDRRLPPAVRALVDLRRGRQRHRRPLRRALDGGRRATSATATPRTTCARSSAALGQPLGWFGTRPEKVPDYVAQMDGGPRRRRPRRSSSTDRRT